MIFLVVLDLRQKYCGHLWPIVKPQMIDEGDCGAIDGMKSGREKCITRRKPAPAPFCQPQIPLDKTHARTRAALWEVSD
jgi:hypothetical protein